MIQYRNGNKTAIIVLHEIYGVNDFMMDVCHQYHAEGYDVYCPNLLSLQTAFPYANAQEAYNTFMHTVGFDAYKEINRLASNLSADYSKLFLVGFSVGATIAWRCSEAMLYDGIVCCYGSRIRDFLMVEPRCPVLLVFAKYDAFDVTGCIRQLQSKKNTEIELLEAGHGFVDAHSESYCHPASKKFNQLRKTFLSNCTK